MTWVWGLKELPASETLVLLALADQANDEGFCWPTQETIATKARCSVRSVKRAIDSLKRAELLRIEHRNSSEGRKSNVYHLNVGAEFSLGINQRDNLALGLIEPVENSDENGTFCCDSSKGSNWHLGFDEDSPGDTGGTWAPLNEPSIKSIPSTESYVTRESGGLDGVDGMEKTSQSMAADGAAGDVAPDWGLIKLCLPSAMIGVLPDSAAQVVTGLLRDALGAGWSEREILKRLAANELPANIRNAPGLVIYRLRDILAAPRLAVVKTSEQVKREKYNAWALAEIEAICEGKSRLDLQAKESLLTSRLCGHFGARLDSVQEERIQSVLQEVLCEKQGTLLGEDARERVHVV